MIETRIQSAMEPIALSGMACRLPGGVRNPDDLWSLLIEGRSGQGDIPSTRFNKKAFHHPDPDRCGTINSNGGYFLQHDVREFDNQFFGIHNLEARYMDPQQRQLLEVVYECLENAGESLESVSGANIGCYIANFTSDFVLMQAQDPDLYHRYSATGFGPTILANRISHIFNLRGPSFVLDTACSSSLYALHMACIALNSGECDAAIVAGANLVQSPEIFVAMAKAGVLSSTSTSHTFDASADGYGRGEGIAALYLRRLDDVVSEQGPIRSIIRGTAVNSNGHTPGITLPGVQGQEEVIRKAYAGARLDLKDTTYVEAHGTGTPVGDPIEVQALADAFSTSKRNRLLIGSNKPNVGHGEAVSGLTSVIKATLTLEHKVIPPTRGIERISPELKLKERNIEIVQQSLPWPKGCCERISVNAFGYGGANAHAIIDAAIPRKAESKAVDLPTSGQGISVLLPISAQHPSSLTAAMEALLQIELSQLELLDVAHTLAKQSRLRHRGFMIGTSSNDGTYFTKGPNSSVPPSPRSLAFVFTGQGAQWPGMGRELLGRFPTYIDVINDLDSHLRSLAHAPSWTIKDTILEEASIGSIYKADRSQTVCTAVQIALVVLLRDWGVQPSAVVGHSSGEIGAAFAAGNITAHEALAIAYYRGLVSQKIPVEGSMLAVGLDAERSRKLLLTLGIKDSAGVACVNSPESTTLSGEPEAISLAAQALTDRKIFNRMLKTDGKAYHSHLMTLVGEDYQNLLLNVFESSSMLPEDAKIDMYSSLTEKMANRESVRTPAYWRANLESPVLFKQALELMVSTSTYHLIEIGPHPALGQPVRDTVTAISKEDLKYSFSLYRGRSDETCLLQLAGQLFMAGHDLHLRNINQVQLRAPGGGRSTIMLDDQRRLGIPEPDDSGVEDLSDRSDGLHTPDMIRERISKSPQTTEIELGYQPKVFNRMPTYSWYHQTPLWAESRKGSESRNMEYRKHDLLGSRLPATPGNLAIWRNQLRLIDGPWIQHHRLGSTIVFPAAAYVATAVEAFLQLNHRPSTGSVIIRQMHLINMLVLSAADKDAIELSTVMFPEEISMTTTSGTWWRFQLSSYAAGSSTVHAKGLIGIKSDDSISGHIVSFPPAFAPEEQAARTMYNRLAAQGLAFGPLFQSMKSIYTDRHRKLAFARSEVSFQDGGNPATTGYSTYAAHPITIDSILQTAIVASCKGVISDLHGKVPVEIGCLELVLDGLPSPSQLCSVFASSTRVGFDAVLLAGELQDPTGRILLKIADVRAINYRETSLAPKSTLQRNPALRILWKPDLTTHTSSSASALEDYAQNFRNYVPSRWIQDDSSTFLASMFDLIIHKYGRMNILELGEEGDTNFLELIGKLSLSHAPRKYRSYTRGEINDSGALHIHGSKSGQTSATFDLIVIPSLVTSTKVPRDTLSGLLSPSGWLLTFQPRVGENVLNPALPRGFIINVPSSIAVIEVARKVVKDIEQESTPIGRILLVHDGTTHKLDGAIVHRVVQEFGCYIHEIHVDSLEVGSITAGSIVVSTMEFSKPFLSTVSPQRQAAMVAITETASVLLWITGGGLFKSQNPEAAIILGLARSLMLERPALKMPVLDLSKQCCDVAQAARHACVILRQSIRDSNPDLEYREHNGSLYISRFVPDAAQNIAFRQAKDAETVEKTIGELGFANLGLKAVGQIDTLRFEQNMMLGIVKAGHVRVQVEAVGLNAKDLYALSDKLNIKNATCGLEFSGTIVAVGSSEANVAVGDRVVVMAPHHFATYEDVPEWACCKLIDHEDATTMSTIPLVFSTALYALEQRAALEDGQSVLIHSGAGGLGIAAIQVARMLGAEVFATVGTEDKRQFLMERLSIPADHIFSSHSTSFTTELLQITSGRGVDVVLNSLTGDLLRASWEVLAPFGVFVEVGKRDILDSGSLNMRVFERAATFTSFDLTDLYWSTSEKKHQTWSRLLQRSINLVRSGQLKSVSPLKVFPASEIVQAFRHFASSKRIGKVAVSLSKGITISAIPFKYQTRFNPRKSYLLVGCLGGLGRSISRWMFQLGARHFTFIGRSGVEKPSASRLVNDLTTAGATVTVCKGSVADPEVVRKAVEKSSKYDIGGVIQASMAIHVSLFKDMNNANWHAGLVQKIQGTWNLHNALTARDGQLDFFLMLSSITGSVGTATESNYCAANAFMDAFGSYRRSRGLPAVALGLGMISEVGFLHENPETEAVLLRKGVHPFTEAELLQIIDISLSEFVSPPSAAVDEAFGLEHQMQGHILTGLELHGFQKIRDQGFVRGTKVLEDPRCTYIAGAFAENTETSGSENDESGLKLPKIVRVALAEHGNSEEPNEALLGAIMTTVVKQIASLLLVGEEALTMDTLLADFGMESMLAAEFRSDIYRAFKVDVPFAILLEKRTQIRTVVESIGRVLLRSS